MNIPFNQLPPQARLWVFAADRNLSEAEAMQLLAEVSAFLEHWTAHNIALTAACKLEYDRFLMIAVDEGATGASGCSIDELYRRIRMLGETFGINLMNNLSVFYRSDAGQISSVSRSEFSDLAASGKISDDTWVFDNSITSVEALRSGKWELPAKESWHISLIGHISPITHQ
jgi:hypothetical protein